MSCIFSGHFKAGQYAAEKERRPLLSPVAQYAGLHSHGLHAYMHRLARRTLHCSLIFWQIQHCNSSISLEFCVVLYANLQQKKYGMASLYLEQPGPSCWGPLRSRWYGRRPYVKVSWQPGGHCDRDDQVRGPWCLRATLARLDGPPSVCNISSAADGSGRYRCRPPLSANDKVRSRRGAGISGHPPPQ